MISVRKVHLVLLYIAVVLCVVIGQLHNFMQINATLTQKLINMQITQLSASR